MERIKKQWHNIIGRNDLPSAEFDFDEAAMELFKEGFRKLFRDGDIPQSFYRRAMFSVFSYAVVFHVLAGKIGTTVGRDSISFAIRMVSLHLGSAKHLLDGFGLSELEKTIQKAEKLKARFHDEGRKLTRRELISGVREIKNAPQAIAILDLIK